MSVYSVLRMLRGRGRTGKRAQVRSTIEDLTHIKLSPGAHDSRADGLCALEAVAWLAGEPHSDRPESVSPVLASFVRYWNDCGQDTDREALKPLLPRLVGTGGDERDEQRARMAGEWLVCHCAPMWLDAAGLAEHAAVLRCLPGARSRAEQATVVAVAAAARRELDRRLVHRDATWAADEEPAGAPHAFEAALWACAADRDHGLRAPRWLRAARVSWDAAWAARHAVLLHDGDRARQVAAVVKLDALACFDAMIVPADARQAGSCASQRRYSSSATS